MFLDCTDICWHFISFFWPWCVRTGVQLKCNRPLSLAMGEALWLSGEGKGGGVGNGEGGGGGWRGGGGGGGGEGEGCRVLEEQNENDGIDFDRDGGTLGNRASGATLHLRSAGHHIYSQCSRYIYSHRRHFTCLSTHVQQTLHKVGLEWLILIDYTIC